MAVNLKIKQALEQMAIENREADFQHTSHEEELVPFELMKQGDLRAVEECVRLFRGEGVGRLSGDPVRHFRYLFVAVVTIACRVCIEGGLAPETSYNLSDLYIRQMDGVNTVPEIIELHEAMVRDYTLQMQRVSHKAVYSRPVSECMAIIERDLQKPITVADLAAELGVSQTYLSTLFKKETSVSVSGYIRGRRVEAAKFLLHYTDFSCIEIAEFLCFSSDAHFSTVFRQYTGTTPTEYRKTHYQKHDD